MNIDGLISFLSADITLKELRVVFAFALQEAKYGACSMSTSDLVSMIGVQSQDIYATMAKLEKKGFLHRLDAGKRGRGATAYNVKIFYPSDMVGFVPIDTNPETLTDRISKELEKQLKDVSEEIKLEKKYRIELESSIINIKKDYELSIAKNEEIIKKVKESEDKIKLEQDQNTVLKEENKKLWKYLEDAQKREAAINKENTQPIVLVKKLFKSIFKNTPKD